MGNRVWVARRAAFGCFACAAIAMLQVQTSGQKPPVAQPPSQAQTSSSETESEAPHNNGAPAEGLNPCAPCSQLRSLPPVDRLPLANFDRALSLATACLRALVSQRESKDSGQKDKKKSCDSTPGNIDELIKTLKTTRDAISDARLKFEQLAAASADLAKLEILPGRRTELPPNDVCPSCDQLWDTLNETKNLSQRVPKPAFDTVQGKEQETERSREAIHQLCKVRADIVRDSRKIDSEGIERNLRFYTWTKTWEAYKEVRRILETQLPQEACR